MRKFQFYNEINPRGGQKEQIAEVYGLIDSIRN